MTMTTTESKLGLHSSVAAWVTDLPARTRILEKYGLDYCCGGKKPLEEACRAHQVDPQMVLRALNAIGVAGVAKPEQDWSTARLTDLANHIEQTHHAWLKRELPRLMALVKKVHHAHGQHHPWLSPLRETVQTFVGEMEAHMFKEESILFPRIRLLDQGLTGAQASVDGPIAVMEHEHDEMGQALGKLRQLTQAFTTPADGCNSFRAMMDLLRELEEETHIHVHKENSILFPRALAQQK